MQTKLKIKQLISIKRVDPTQGITMLGVYKKKLMGTCCAMSPLCIEALNTSIEKGLLSLKYKGFSVAYSLQNPYISLIPKSSIQLRVVIYYLSIGLSQEFHRVGDCEKGRDTDRLKTQSRK